MRVRSRAMRGTVPDKLDELTGDQPDSGASVSPGRPGQGERESACAFRPLSGQHTAGDPPLG